MRYYTISYDLIACIEPVNIQEVAKMPIAFTVIPYFPYAWAIPISSLKLPCT